MALPSAVRGVASAMWDTDLGALRWLTPLRVAVVTTAIVAFLLAVGQPVEALLMGIGSLVTGVADQRGLVAARIKSMAIMAVGVSIAVTLGIGVSEWSALRIGSTVIIAFACGYVARVGPRAGIAGQVSLVVFTVFAGSPVPIEAAGPEGLFMLAGGALQMLVAVAFQLTGRTGGVRTDICIAWRSAGHSLRGSRLRHGATSPVVKLQAARAGVEALEADPAVAGPLRDLVAAQVRFGVGGLIVLSAPFDGTPDQRAALARVTRAAGDVAIAIGHAVEMPSRSRGVQPTFARFAQAVDEMPRLGDARLNAGIAEMRSGLEAAAEVIRAGVPRGSATSVPVSRSQAVEPLSAMLGRVTWDDVILRHALRLAIACGVATMIALASSFPHSYWIPMTVAWVLRPDLAGTGVRVAARLLGTVAGLVLSGLIVVLAGAGVGPVLAIVFIGALVFAAFLVPNYAVSTAGATMFIIGMFSYLGDPLLETLDARALGTFIAGLLALGVILLIPSRTTEALCGVLAGLAADVGRYADLVRTGAAVVARAAALDELASTRVRAGKVVESATQEARLHRMHPERAARILRDLVRAMAIVAAADISSRGHGGGAVSLRAVDDATDLALRLHARQAGEPVPPRAALRAPLHGDDAARAIDDAQVTLDLALGDATPLAT